MKQKKSNKKTKVIKNQVDKIIQSQKELNNINKTISIAIANGLIKYMIDWLFKPIMPIMKDKKQKKRRKIK